MPQKIYLDNNATTAMVEEVKARMSSCFDLAMGNPSSAHSFGRKAKALLIESREKIAHVLGVRPHEIIFTSGATEGANLLMRGIFGANPSGHLITSSVEHACIFETANALEKQGVHVTYLKPGKRGAVTDDQVREALRSTTRLIALTAVNSETGVKTPFESIARIAQEVKVPFFLDGVALLGKELFSLPDGVTAACFSGHKLHAPKGVGFNFIRKSLSLTPYLTGGPQEFQRRGGTENLLGIVGVAEAVSLLPTLLPAATKRMTTLRDKLETELLSRLTNVVVNGEGPRICNTSNLAFLGIEAELLFAQLDMRGIAVSFGAACSSGAQEPSRVLVEMGLGREVVNASLRFSLSRLTTEEEITRTIETVVETVRDAL